MSSPIPSVPEPTSNVNSTSSEGATSGSKAPTGEVSSSTQIGSMQELKQVAPDVYRLTLVSIAQRICSTMKRNQDNLKKMMREYRRNG